MKRNGFTLIELLAVIVILAIIALIATPIVMNVIKNTKKGAAERSAENYLRAVETAIAAERLDGPIEDGTYVITDNGSLQLKTDDSVIIVVNVSGNDKFNGTIQIENGNVIKISDFQINSVTLIVSGNSIEPLDNIYEKYINEVEKSSEALADGTYLIQEDGSLCPSTGECTDETKIELALSGTTPTGGIVKIADGKVIKSKSNILTGDYTIVYYNETTGTLQTSSKICMLVEDLNNDGFGLGDKYICNPGDGQLRVFHVLEDGDKTTLKKWGGSTVYAYNADIGTTDPNEVSLLMKGSIGSSKWGNSTDGPVTAMAKIEEKTGGWREDIEVNLPTYKQIYIANGNKENRYSEWIKPVGYARYWTSTFRPSYGAYIVGVQYMELSSNINSIYPVITISKDQLD